MPGVRLLRVELYGRAQALSPSSGARLVPSELNVYVLHRAAALPHTLDIARRGLNNPIEVSGERCAISSNGQPNKGMHPTANSVVLMCETPF